MSPETELAELKSLSRHLMETLDQARGEAKFGQAEVPSTLDPKP
jgi:hypothetical protein